MKQPRCISGFGQVLTTIAITSTTEEVTAKHAAWREFAAQFEMQVATAKQQYTLRRKR